MSIIAPPPPSSPSNPRLVLSPARTPRSISPLYPRDAIKSLPGTYPRIYTAPIEHCRRATRPGPVTIPIVLTRRHLSRLYLCVARTDTKSKVSINGGGKEGAKGRGREKGGCSSRSSKSSPGRTAAHLSCRCSRRDKFPRIYSRAEKRRYSRERVYSACVLPEICGSRFAKIRPGPDPVEEQPARS